VRELDRTGDALASPVPTPAMTPLLELRGVSKRFPGVTANRAVDLAVFPGEVHTLLGENGAGKSTLMKVVYGLYRPDEGEIRVKGAPVRIDGPSAAIRHGIGMVHQHFMLVPTLTVVENVALGFPARKGPFPDLGAISRRVREIGERYGLDVDPDVEVWKLSVGERQRVELVKALSRDVDLLILDEPTAVLTPGEAGDLFTTLRRLVATGVGIVFISHKLHEVLAVSDRITIMRRGGIVGETRPGETTREELARLMVGRDVSFSPDKDPASPGEPTLVVSGLVAAGDRGNAALDGVDLYVSAGEIVGVAGVSGNGQRELAETIAGLREMTAGTIVIAGTDVTGRGPAAARKAGLGYVPEERMTEGAIGEFTIAENLHLLDHGRFTRRGLLETRTMRRHAERLVADYDVKAPGVDTHGRALSGGNIQKMILAREINAGPKVLLAAQPTRGVDVGAAENIHRRIVAARDAGTAVLVISEDLDEILGLCDRVVVLYEGRIMGEREASPRHRDDIGLLMAGIAVNGVEVP